MVPERKNGMSWILIGLFIVVALYSAGLHQIREWYTKNNLIWLTVVIGDGIVWCATFLAAMTGVTVTAQEAVTFHLISLVVAGTPVIAWQIWDSNRRGYFVNKRKGTERHESTDKKRSGVASPIDQ
jgi:hypothetical protein